MKHILSLRELTGDDLAGLVERAIDIKETPNRYARACENKGLLIVMQKTSTRTTLSFSSAMFQMGGYAVKLDWEESNFSIASLRHEVGYASRNCDVILARMKRSEDLFHSARHSQVPVINGCCNRYHPSQAIADVMTIREVAGTFDGTSVPFVGVHNNVANSLVVACTRTGVKVNLVTPLVQDAAWDEELMREATSTGLVSTYETLAEAATRSDFVYTDAWVDMESFADPAYAEERERRAVMLPVQVNAQNLGGAEPYLMHPMPIHPGYEIADELVDHEKSVIFHQAENRLYAGKALLAYLAE